MDEIKNNKLENNGLSNDGAILILSSIGLLLSSIIIGGLFGPNGFFDLEGLIYGFFTSIFGGLVLFGIYFKFKNL